ncbi:MAG: nitroreductase family deazaflavin-dependent oxidoreductase [Chloroflexota bacterium]|nr:nitroreductase family deazaflavin-dependent oxidoreductase [Chloroflexota bacterium]
MTTSDHYIFPYPRGILLPLLRLPIYLYRAGMTVILDIMHVMILTTHGRRSGTPRYTPIEYRRHGSKIYVISAWGKETHWYKNLCENSGVTLALNGRVVPARATPVTSESESLLVLHLFRRPNPLVYDAILARLGRAHMLDVRTLPDISNQYTIVRFDIQPGEPELPAPPDDLRWLPFGAGFALVLFAAVWAVVLIGRAKEQR